ncbi:MULTISPECIES: glucose/quinate/shikimate family membrane-bound PQQ-dependent dehydrogenase [Agrobacterium]|jgi:quinoprotein glucose dehydrogenase|uniref:glucose/quinate/shikimate family membrane-bound PQQ-dependent dehydrogenase n=1 Tax=Agrobacterium TaxID=357 RepID=UPI000200AF36|nr:MULTISPECIES: glucose/quinate/shikimate family membrane-bound PQQ-dependent dehydrogenase [Agrobacterium]ADY67232.1 Glucose dehydrogenase [Agrobacterium tumefaciens]MDR5010773.1 glucose/quinate/shikimate family membrane-bound PQQ-dependent dehydrogenase [Agrobacterium tumefaciens]MDX8327005.1 glucose/quinate/shikimate family membrane-bound PQQ-dependent dehydrogenase [Agrobacterium tumefaciens]NSY45509.1 glucose/quinate/shikimate family membrane-bound PQQ-dependent dehydrogenase [Agrobacteri
MAVTVTAVILSLIGLALFGFGSQLVMLGGSFYYVLSGMAFLLTAILLFKRNRAALHVYAVFIVATLAWALWEVGFDWWQLGPRGGIVILIGLWLLVPWVRKPLGFSSPTGLNYGPNAWPLALSVLASIVVAGYSMAQDPHDQAGSLSEEKVASAPIYGGDVPDGDWHQYGRTPYGQRYSPLTQVNVDNVSQLKEAWRYQTGDVKLPDDVGETTYQVTPLKIGNTLYICTPHNWAIAIDAATGKEKWKYDPNVGLNPDRQHQTCRGVSYYAEPNAAQGTACAQRVYLPTSDARLIALDAATGQICTSFADQGVLHLEQGMKYNPAGYYYSTSPPVIAAGKIIIGGAVNDNYSTQEQSGVIRAFDVNSGALIWNWDSGNPEKTEPIAAGETYTTNSPNSWSVLSYDEGLGLVYVPLGNQVPDQLGMGRSENVEKYSSSIVALDINTGKDRWVRQTVHHDLWDMDVPAQPVLLDITKNGQSVPALVGPTKQGDIYVLDRRTGEPLLPITEEPAPGGTIPEDFSSPTQPTTALSFKPEPLKEKDMWGVSMFDQLACRIRFHQLNYQGRYTPPSLNGSIIYPGNFGTFNWGSVAVDPERQVMFGMPTYLAFTSQLVPRADIPPKGQDEKGSEQGLNRNDGAPYGVFMGPFLGPLKIPCQAPPWGYVAGADLRTGDIAYKHKNGTVHDMTPLPLPFKVGVPGIGGPMITKGGVAFLGAAVDNYLRAYNLTTGKQLWEARLPAGGQATPMTYALDGGKQYVVMVAGGHGSVGTKPGDYVIAYTLP